MQTYFDDYDFTLDREILLSWLPPICRDCGAMMVMHNLDENEYYCKYCQFSKISIKKIME